MHLSDLSANTACSFDNMVRIPQLWEIMGYIEDAFQARAPHGFGKACKLAFCPDGGSPDIVTCTCTKLFATAAKSDQPPAPKGRELGEVRPEGVCIISADAGSDRPLDANFDRLIAASHKEVGWYWSMTHHLNRLYALLHGYRFRRPEVSDEDLKLMLADGVGPPRLVQWSIVRLIQKELEDESCDYVVWMDSDAYIVSSEPLEDLLVQSGLLQGQS